MIASDLAARGLNLPGVTHVFNLDIPTMSKAYLHRVGRTARAGEKERRCRSLPKPRRGSSADTSRT